MTGNLARPPHTMECMEGESAPCICGAVDRLVSRLDDPDPRERAYGAVYRLLRDYGERLPLQPVVRNAMIWQAVAAALAAYENEGEQS